MGLDGSGSSGKRMRPLLGLLAYASITGEYAPALPGAAAVELGPQLQPDPRRHRGQRPRAAPPGHALDAPRDPPGDQHRRRRLRPVADRAPPADRARLLRHQGPAPDAPLRRDLPGALRGPVHRHLDRRARRHDDRRPLLRHDRAQDRRPDLGQHRGRARSSPPTTRRSSPATAQFGWALGLAFQLNDDVLGIWGREQATGKEPTDLAKHKKTLPVIYALEHATPADRARLEAVYADAEPGAGRDRRGDGDPRADGRPGLHARGGSPLARRGDRPARRRGRGPARGAGEARADHAERDLARRSSSAGDRRSSRPAAAPSVSGRSRRPSCRPRASASPGPWPPAAHRSTRR